MLKALEMSYYTEGYRTMHSNCVDLPMAGAAGFHQVENYFYYSFLYAVMMNWGTEGDDWVESRRILLSRLGLTLKVNEVTHASDLMSAIKRSIDQQSPVVMIANYQHLFFLSQYEHVIDDHAFIISEYDPTRKLVIIRENQLNKEVTLNVMKGEPFDEVQ